ncbi:esterase [Cronobacter malonaticus]|uniref:Esterase n=1 Tax=Cronobacter malonaticus TaxID=413503 RepID=V5U1F9_9ENTR|nr:esterase [Cronobacter malonaticus]CCJ95876.1 Esterase ybfF [Cronobacter malonaticus 681]CCJ97359.1 Esterase ybfF [Cronobacter malonaticus 507]AHB71203.1 acyl-CoA esterase [Cronobacter malonaticus]ALX79375.1 acyl-CoA esterase [Cronobacter malonaticus LMG 23826]EGT4278496.1 esterase [Cronobacter malonaticus]
MKLNTRTQSAQQPTQNTPIVLIHGLFGSLDNLGVLARDLVADHDVVQVDLRNHGLSGRSETMDYPAMAQDILETLDALGLNKVILIGHSMGGKAAMAVTALAPERIEKLVAIDIAPVDYQVRRHDEIFTAVNAVNDAGVTSRQQAAEIMRQHIAEEGVVQFLLKSFVDGEWRFNVPVLWNQYSHIVGWETVPAWHGPALFIRGGASPYVEEAHREALLSQFPKARAHVIAGAGHWVHAEKPQAVLRAIRRFLETD